jgi:copper chaperone CopZ
MAAGISVAVYGMKCANCVSQVRRVLQATGGVQSVEVDLGTGRAHVTFDPTTVEPQRLLQVLTASGYYAERVEDWQASFAATRWARPLLAGALGVTALLLLYLAIVSLTESPTHAWQQLRQDLGFVLPIMAGFGVQAGLFAHLRWNVLARPSAALPASGGATSTAAMVACCAHHLAEVLPFLGLSAAAVFLNEYRTWFLLTGVAMNLVGIAVMLRIIRKVEAGACHAARSDLKGTTEVNA